MVERFLALVLPGAEIAAARRWALEQVKGFRWEAWRQNPPPSDTTPSCT